MMTRHRAAALAAAATIALGVALFSLPAGDDLEAAPPLPQDPAASDSLIRERRSGILHRVWELQDTRAGLQLSRYLVDADPEIRIAAAVALGSVQDTTVLDPIFELMQSEDTASAEAAAFALGQTARTMSEAGRAEVEGRALALLPGSAGAVRLIDEMGKFGTTAGLGGLLERYRDAEGEEAGALIMSVARFGIRSVVTPEGVDYLLTFVDGDTEWEVAYALQRCGDNPQARAALQSILSLASDGDRLVRMNFAVLLGKLPGEMVAVEPLAALAATDDSWMVRVAALRAIGNLKLKVDDRIGRVILGQMGHQDEHVALAATNAAGRLDFADSATAGSPAAKVLDALRRMSANERGGSSWRLQADAAQSLAAVDSAGAGRYIDIRERDEPRLRYAMVGALGRTGTPAAAASLLEIVDPEDPGLHRALLEALQEAVSRNGADAGLRTRIRTANVAGLGSGDMAVMTTAAQNLGDSLLLDAASAGPLLETLGRLSAPADIEAIQAVCQTLGRLKAASAVPQLETLLESRDPAAALAAASALEAITGKEYRTSLNLTEPLHADYDFAYLESLPDTLRLETDYGNVLIRLDRRRAPLSILNIAKLADNGFYRGLYFHRVVSTFVVQGGDPRGDGWGGPGFSMRSEFSPDMYRTGSVGIASAGKDTEGCQLFIAQSPQPHLDGRYTIIGRVISGMDIVNRIQVGDRIVDLRPAR
jgi:peptidylprolyl isomerase